MKRAAHETRSMKEKIIFSTFFNLYRLFSIEFSLTDALPDNNYLYINYINIVYIYKYV